MTPLKVDRFRIEKLLLRKAECAAELAVSARTFERLVSAGCIPKPIAYTVRSKRWKREWIEAYIEERERSSRRGPPLRE